MSKTDEEYLNSLTHTASTRFDEPVLGSLPKVGMLNRFFYAIDEKGRVDPRFYQHFSNRLAVYEHFERMKSLYDLDFIIFEKDYALSLCHEDFNLLYQHLSEVVGEKWEVVGIDTVNTYPFPYGYFVTHFMAQNPQIYELCGFLHISLDFANLNNPYQSGNA